MRWVGWADGRWWASSISASAVWRGRGLEGARVLPLPSFFTSSFPHPALLPLLEPHPFLHEAREEDPVVKLDETPRRAGLVSVRPLFLLLRQVANVDCPFVSRGLVDTRRRLSGACLTGLSALWPQWPINSPTGAETFQRRPFVAPVAAPTDRQAHLVIARRLPAHPDRARQRVRALRRPTSSTAYRDESLALALANHLPPTDRLQPASHVGQPTQHQGPLAPSDSHSPRARRAHHRHLQRRPCPHSHEWPQQQQPRRWLTPAVHRARRLWDRPKRPTAGRC